MIATFGDTEFKNDASAFGSRLRLADGPLELNWHHCSVTSEFIGDFFALKRGAAGADYNEAHHSIGYLVNELLENAVKFRLPGEVLVESTLEDGCFEVKVTNMIDEATSERFSALLEEITSCDPGELLIQRIEANAEDASSSGSGLGLLTLMSDYGARLGWRFSSPAAGQPVRLETFAALDLA